MAELLLQIIRFREVKKKVGLGTSSIYREMSADRFPQQIPLLGRHVGWASHEIDAWIRWRVAVARNPEAARKHWSAWLPKSDFELVRLPDAALADDNGHEPAETKAPGGRDTSV
jgi:prophage regulatory protein